MAGDLFTEHSHPPRNEKSKRIKRANKELKRVRMKIQKKSLGGGGLYVTTDGEYTL